jgi:RimJ/RimL family protein N-acetyltransferase
MPVKMEFSYASNNEGEVPVELHDWIKTLPFDEQQEFNEAEARQIAFRQEAIDRGDMIIEVADTSDKPLGWKSTLSNYVWRDAETEKKGKEHDPAWLVYWNRYLTECNIKFNIVKKQV